MNLYQLLDVCSAEWKCVNDEVTRMWTGSDLF